MTFPARNMNIVAVEVLLTAIGTACTFGCIAPCDGKVVWMGASLDVTTDGTNVITSAIDGTAITGGTITFASAATVNVGHAAIPTAANVVKRGQVLTAITDGGGTVGQARVVFVIDQQGF